MPGRTRISCPGWTTLAAAWIVANGRLASPGLASFPLVATHQVRVGVASAGSRRVRTVPEPVPPPSGSVMTARTSYGVSGSRNRTLPAHRLLVIRVMSTPVCHTGAPWTRHSTWAVALAFASRECVRRTPTCGLVGERSSAPAVGGRGGGDEDAEGAERRDRAHASVGCVAGRGRALDGGGLAAA